MSSYIPKQPKRERDQILIKLDRDVLCRLGQYRRYLESIRDYIVSSVLELVFRKDKALVAWPATEDPDAYPWSAARRRWLPQEGRREGS